MVKIYYYFSIKKIYTKLYFDNSEIYIPSLMYPFKKKGKYNKK